MICNNEELPNEFYLSQIKSYFFDNKPPYSIAGILEYTGLTTKKFNQLKTNKEIKEFLELI